MISLANRRDNLSVRPSDAIDMPPQWAAAVAVAAELGRPLTSAGPGACRVREAVMLPPSRRPQMTAGAPADPLQSGFLNSVTRLPERRRHWEMDGRSSGR